MTTTVEKCQAKDCPFYAMERWYGRCSQHSKYTPIKIIAIMIKPQLPTEILDLIWDFFHVSMTPVPLTDDQLISVLGMDHHSVFIEPSIIDERAVWLSHHSLPYIHCDDITKAMNILDLPAQGKLRNEDTQRLMTAIDGRNPLGYTRIAMEKALVLKTFHHGELSRDMFPIGLCYHGTRVCTSRMSFKSIRRIFSLS